jgi:hypothetical protein
MARSALTPLRIAPTGGIAWTSPDDGGRRSLEQVIVARLSPGMSLHPFDVAEGYTVPGGEYETASRRQSARFDEHVRSVFRDLEAQRRARLVAMESGPVRDDGRRAVVIRWQNLETGGQEAQITGEV